MYWRKSSYSSDRRSIPSNDLIYLKLFGIYERFPAFGAELVLSSFLPALLLLQHGAQNIYPKNELILI